MQSMNPATEAVIRDYPELSPEETDERLDFARQTFDFWRRASFEERGLLMARAAEVLRRRKGELAALMTSEMGKVIVQAEAEVEKCAWVCDFYAERAEGFLSEEAVQTDASRSYVRFDPLGPVLAVMPWNFPLWQVFRFAAPALMAGNVGLLKHASNVPGCALAIEEVFREAGFPKGAFQTLLVGSKVVEAVVRHPAVTAVTLTGSDPAGRSVAAAAGAALKKTVLELGGSDPFVVLRDADVAKAARTAAQARCINNGQSCIAAKRFIVEAPVFEAFEREFVKAMSGLTVGDPADRKTEVGPLARQDLMEDLHDQVYRSLKAGAQLKCGGKRLPVRGFFYPPTVLSRVEPGMAAFEEETFGPVAALALAEDADHAVALANASPFGLGACLWTADLALAGRLAAEIESGSVFVNGMVKSDPRLPFGGVKLSGYGRELSAFGIREFVNIKTVWMA
ncbi:MAG: NAD-dependent succinate-semialdehyde dehydrogenase [Acidobacteriota bacterium]